MPRFIQAKSILNKKKQRDPWFLDDYTINPYSGCSFNCLYCYIRGSKYGSNMTRSLTIKENAVELLDKELGKRASKGEHGFIVLASATDPYLQLEKEIGITRKLLEVILKHRFPVHVITKSDLVQRDFDLLQRIDETAILPEDLAGKLDHGVILTFSFSAVSDEVAAIFEPGATPPSLRLKTLKASSGNGFKTGVSMMPLLPFISDTADHLKLMMKSFNEAGAHYVMPATLTLFGSGPSDSKVLTLRAISRHYPELLPRYQRYFEHNHGLPDYYQKAFKKKMREMLLTHGLTDRIV